MIGVILTGGASSKYILEVDSLNQA